MTNNLLESKGGNGRKEFPEIGLAIVAVFEF